MEDITLGSIQNILIFIATIITAIGTISGVVIWSLKKVIKKEIEPIEQGIKETNDNLKEVDSSQCKNYLVRFLADVERGEKLDSVEMQRAYEAYEHYTHDLGKNNYIHAKWEKLMKGKV